MNYYNPFLAAWLVGETELAEQSNEVVASFNGLLGSIYQLFRVPVADVATAFDTTDSSLVDIAVAIPVPLNVQDLRLHVHVHAVPEHPRTPTGYGVIAQAFLDVLP